MSENILEKLTSYSDEKLDFLYKYSIEKYQEVLSRSSKISEKGNQTISIIVIFAAIAAYLKPEKLKTDLAAIIMLFLGVLMLIISLWYYITSVGIYKTAFPPTSTTLITKSENENMKIMKAKLILNFSYSTDLRSFICEKQSKAVVRCRQTASIGVFVLFLTFIYLTTIV